MFGLALVSVVQSAAGEPGHGPFDDPAVTAEPLRGLDARATAGDVGADPAFAEPAAQVVVVVAFVRVELARARSARSTPEPDRWDAPHERFQTDAVVHVRARDAERERQSIPVGDQADFSIRACHGQLDSVPSEAPLRSPHADGVDRTPRPVQFPAGAEFIKDDAVEPGPGPGSAPLGETSADCLPARAEHRRELPPVQPEVATKTIAAKVSRSPARHRPPTCGRMTFVGGTTRRNSTHNSSGTSRSIRSVMHGSTQR